MLKLQYRHKYIATIILGYALTLAMGEIFYVFAANSLSIEGLAAATRITIGFFTGSITAVALIITLTANLYTPHLVELFVKDRIILTGTSFIVISNFVILLCSFVSVDSQYYDEFSQIGFWVSCLTIAGIIPYLHYASQFLRPRFFLPKLERRATGLFKSLISDNYTDRDCKEAFHNIDIIANICSTASKRHDKELMILSLKSLHNIFEFILNSEEDHKAEWRVDTPMFIPGLSQEGEFYLERTKAWPEAYLLGKMLRILNSLEESKNDVIPFVCDNLLTSLDIVTGKKQDHLIEFHLLIFNSIIRKAIDRRNIERLQSISYYYRLGIELLSTNPKYLKFATENFLHYGEVCIKKDLFVGKETILFDLSRIVLYMAYESEDMAIQYYDKYLLSQMEKGLKGDKKVETIIFRSIIKTYWEAKAKQCDSLCFYLEELFIKGKEFEHLQTLEYLLRYDRDLHWEFNDRLLSFVRFSPTAYQLAQDFYKAKNTVKAS